MESELFTSLCFGGLLESMSNDVSRQLRRSVRTPIRENISWTDMWKGSDRGLIWCWERGRQRQTEEPDLMTRAREGEFVSLAWKRGTLQYLATWQGLRGDDLDIDFDTDRKVVCSKTEKTIVFKAGITTDGD